MPTLFLLLSLETTSDFSDFIPRSARDKERVGAKTYRKLATLIKESL